MIACLVLIGQYTHRPWFFHSCFKLSKFKHICHQGKSYFVPWSKYIFQLLTTVMLNTNLLQMWLFDFSNGMLIETDQDKWCSWILLQDLLQSVTVARQLSFSIHEPHKGIIRVHVCSQYLNFLKSHLIYRLQLQLHLKCRMAFAKVYESVAAGTSSSRRSRGSCWEILSFESKKGNKPFTFIKS